MSRRRLCAIHQPHYLPWLRYFHKIAAADVFVLLDDVQYNRNGWQNRNRIQGANGPVLLTVPVRHPYQAPLPAVEVAGDAWRAKHRNALRTSYGRSPGFSTLYPRLEEALGRPWSHLNHLNRAVLGLLLDRLGVTTPIVASSELRVAGTASERLANLCRAVGATHYLTGGFAARSYLEPEVLQRAGVAVVCQTWKAPVYRRLHAGAGFVPDLSLVDLLFCEGDSALPILLEAGGVDEPDAL